MTHFGAHAHGSPSEALAAELAELRRRVADLARAIATVGPWLTYTPQIDQGATTNIAKTIDIAQHRRVGAHIDLELNLAVTGAGTAGAQVTVTLPVASAWTGFPLLGVGGIYDASANTMYVGAVTQASTTTITIETSGIAPGGWGVSPNLALANTDRIRCSIRYRVA